MNKMVIIILVCMSLALIGCSETYPPPEEAIKACIEAGKVPLYTSRVEAGTKFTCLSKEDL